MKPGEYIPRHLSGRVAEYLAQFPIVVVLGARQIGKTTLLEHELNGWRRMDLEDAGTAEMVGRDPRLFLHDHREKIWFDEAHRVPELFPALRVAADADRTPGRYVLSGSATGALTRQVSESLAGRAGLLVLRPLTVSETLRRPPSSFLEMILQSTELPTLLTRLSYRPLPTRPTLNELLAGGGFPEPTVLQDAGRRQRWFESYIQLVSERDLLPVTRRMRPVAVRRFLRMLAVRHGQPVNLAHLARDFGTSSGSISDFLDLLEGAFLWWRVEPYLANIGKRLVRSPKGWIADSGLLHALLDVHNWEELEVHPAVGASFEGSVLQELRGQASLMDIPPRFHHWRTQAGAEVDIVLERGRHLYPIEVKRATRIHPYDLRGMNSFMTSFSDRTPFGIVLYRGDAGRVSDRVMAIPVGQIL